MKKLLFHTICICCLFLTGSCVDEIEFEVPREFQNSTAIIGKIVKGNPSRIELLIQNVFDFSFEEPVYPSAQSVRLVNDKGQQLVLKQTGSGYYFQYILPSDDFEVEVGHSYHVEIDMFDGKKFRSIPTKLLAVPKMKNVEMNLVEKELIGFRDVVLEQTWIEYFIETDLIPPNQSEKVNLKWDFQRTYKLTDNERKSCYVYRGIDFDRISTLDADLVSSNTATHVPVLEQIVNNTIVEGQYVTFVMEALDDGALKFWENTNELSTHSGTFYEPPPGKLATNFETVGETEGSIFGYFNATEEDYFQVFVDSIFINQFRARCPKTGESTGLCEECCDCTTLGGSTLEKPPFWVD